MAPQIARPEADVTNEGWTTQDEGHSSLYNVINEVSPDDVDYAVSTSGPDHEVYVTRFSDLQDPGADIGHILRFRVGKQMAVAAECTLLVELRQDYVDEDDQGELIADYFIDDVPLAFTQYNVPLSEEEAALITDYTSLFLRLVADQPE